MAPGDRPVGVRSQDGRRRQVERAILRREILRRAADRPEEPVPVPDVLVPGVLEVAGQRSARLEARLLRPRAEAEGEPRDAVREDQLRHARDVAGVGGPVGPRHPAVRREVLPAVRRAHVAHALAGRARVRGERQGRRARLGEQHRAALVGAGPRAVVEAAEPQVRGKQRVEAQRVGQALGVRGISRVVQARLDVDDVGVVVRADPQRQGVPRMAVRRDDRGDAGLEGPHVPGGIPLHLAPEPVVVGDDEAEVADLGPVHPGPVDLVEDPVADREPDPAGEVRGPDRVLLAARPGGGGTGRAGAWAPSSVMTRPPARAVQPGRLPRRPGRSPCQLRPRRPGRASDLPGRGFRQHRRAPRCRGS